MKAELITKVFNAFNIQRWNDQVRPIELVEIDKHGHKMAIAYCLAKYEDKMMGEEGERKWHDLIKGGVFELLRRATISDIKSPVYSKIKQKYPDAYKELNKWAWKELNPCLEEGEMKNEIESYLNNGGDIDETACKILKASHAFASYWEWQIIRNLNPASPYTVELDKEMHNELEKYMDIAGFKKLIAKQKIIGFVDLFGQLRFQVRWSQALRLPKTSVLGHSMFVSCLMYFFTREIKACDERVRNNFFGGLFHDLPESVTRDIISPVKRGVPGLEGVIDKIEKDLVESLIYPHLEESWIQELSYYINDEFDEKISINGAPSKKTWEEITNNYNKNKFHPIDGKLIKVADHLAAYVEACIAIRNGFISEHLINGEKELRLKYTGFNIGGIDIGELFSKLQDLILKKEGEGVTYKKKKSDIATE